MEYDVVVIGGGPAGVTAALRARELGASVALVERGNLGGTCTNDGCVPTRVLAKAARLARDAEQLADYGLIGARPEVDFAQVVRRAHEIVYRVHEKKQLRAHLERDNVRVFAGAGAARFVDAHAVALADGQTVTGARFIICAGGHARRLPIPGGELALTHSDVWRMQRLPRAIAIIGGAATGCQLASIFSAFGARVALLDVSPRLLGGEDDAVSDTITQAFAARGLTVATGIAAVERIERTEDGLRLIYAADGAERTLDVETVIQAVGWPGNADDLNLAALGVRTERGYIAVDDALRTSVPHIYAAGDITGRMMLVQSATGEGDLAAEHAVLGAGRTSRHGIVPHGGFTDPEYGSVGLTEQQARAQHDCVVTTVPFADMDRAVIDGHTEGFCKLIVERSSRHILGAHIVGEQAVEILQLVAAGMAAGLRIEQLAELELAYPTFTAIVGVAARRLGRELHVVPLDPRWRALGHLGAAEWERSER